MKRDDVSEEVVRDAEESIVAALQESDTAVEALHDSGTDAPGTRTARQWGFGAAGLLLVALGYLVGRRRS